MKNMVIYLDGKGSFVTKEYAQYLSPGEVNGKGMFETLQVVGDNSFALEDHIARMKRGLALLKIRMPFTKKLLKQQIQALMRKNNLVSARVRFSVWREERKVRSAIVCEPSTKYTKSKVKKGLSAVTSKEVRNKNWLSHVKSIEYGLFKKARLDAKTKGYDEAILCNSKKHVVEGSYTNIFYVKGDQLFTPSVDCGCLNGITRKYVIDCARSLGIKSKTVRESISKFKNADEVFVTNSAMGIMPVTSIDRRVIGSGCGGEITLKLKNEYENLISR